MAEPLVQARGLTKRFDEFVAVDAVDFDIAKGEAFVLRPQRGGQDVDDEDDHHGEPHHRGQAHRLRSGSWHRGPQIRQRLGVFPQEDNLDVELRSRKTSTSTAGITTCTVDIKARIVDLLEFAQLTDRADSPVEPLSGGMKRRLTIARA